MTPASHKAPTRTCVGCGARDAQSSMVRLRFAEERGVVDAREVPGGRSAYVHELAGCVSALERSKGLGKSLRTVISKQMRLELIESLGRHDGGRAVL